MPKTTERLSLEVCDSFAEKNSFCKYLSPFTGLIKNSNLIKSNFPQDLNLSNMVRKTNFLSISVLVSEIVTFMSKKKSFL